jgi:hypothetical protein
MKNRISPSSPAKAWLLTALAAATALLCGFKSHATNYAGNGSTSFGGNIGKGSLSVTDNGTNLTFTITPNGGNLGGNDLALYIDTGVGGFSSTTNFLDAGDGGRTSLSGYSSQGQSVMTFTNGFSPSYGISFSDGTGGYTSLFSLANGGNNSFTYITGTGTSPDTLTISAANIGLTPGVKATIRIFGSFISGTGYRSAEAIAGNDFTSFNPSQGWIPFNQTAYGIYTFDSPPVPTQPVTFRVDMTEEIALGNFNPANGDSVDAIGSFQTNGVAGFQLSPSAANTNLYTGTYPVADLVGTTETFNFQYVSVSTGATNMEGVDPRPFTLQSGGQTNALVYFDDLFPTPSATTNDLTFSINMAPELYLGSFNPANGDQIEVLGTFENPKWTQGFILTNNPGSSASNIYSGTIADGNYPGSFENYKFVLVAGSGTVTYESFNGGANRDFFTPAGSYSFPLAYFNDVSNVYATPVTFQVDMTAQLAAGTFNPANGDTVSAAGTFQPIPWTTGVFVLTNNPAAANSNVYSGTCIDADAPGTGEQYKFVITSGGVATYEDISANRTFLLGSTAQTLPVVYYDNLDPNNVLLVPTLVTFTVNMTNAVDVYGNVFNPNTDAVLVDGDFTTPPWQVMNNATDPTILTDYPQNVMTNNPIGSSFYSASFLIPAGTALEVTYKYGIDFNVGGINTNVDNEAPFGDNHVRYIRATGTYQFPVDIFGIQRTNAAAATEPSFGDLTIAPVTGRQLSFNWLGRPGVYLEYTTNLANGPWVQLNATSGTNSTSFPETNPAAFFQLINP